MTETAPLATLSRPRPLMDGWSDARRRKARARQGMPIAGVELRVVGEDGTPLAWDGKSVGELEVRGPWIASSYYDDPRGAEAFHDGWFRTGDVVNVDPTGSMQITDRAKDVIKSGGGGSSSLPLENTNMGPPHLLEGGGGR